MIEGRTVVLVTGPPLNGRDEYVQGAVSSCNEVAYYHLFKYMRQVAPRHGISNLTRLNVLSIGSSTLAGIRRDALLSIITEIKSSTKQLNLVSTPARFHVRASPHAPSGRVDGLLPSDLQLLCPDLIVTIIDDLINVRERLRADRDWQSRVDPSLKTLASWRADAISFIDENLSDLSLNVPHIIFARAHDHQTFCDLIERKKPIIYLSYHITGAGEEELRQKEQIRTRLQEHFVCLDPYTIKDWDIIHAYDQAVEAGKLSVGIGDVQLDVDEVEQAIDMIRTQTVTRDYSLINNAHATVVCHLSPDPSYGVMAELIHTVSQLSHPVYVLYPFLGRPSPFFEYYASPPEERIIRKGTKNEDLSALIDRLISRMLQDISRGVWTTWPQHPQPNSGPSSC